MQDLSSYYFLQKYRIEIESVASDNMKSYELMVSLSM